MVGGEGISFNINTAALWTAFISAMASSIAHDHNIWCWAV